MREELTGLVDRQIPEIQDQLERNLDDEARRGTDARLIERRRRTLRENTLTSVLGRGSAPPPAPPGGGDAWAYDPTARPRRRIVPD
jgi:hypothetical protein